MNAVVCIMGDGHHPPGTSRKMNEVEAVKGYITIVSMHRAKVTLLVTEKRIVGNQRFWRDVSAKGYSKLGACTYWTFTFLNKIFEYNFLALKEMIRNDT